MSEPKVAEPTSSWHCDHLWSKWKDIGSGTVSVVFGLGERPVLLQERRCYHCNLAARHVVELGGMRNAFD